MQQPGVLVNVLAAGVIVLLWTATASAQPAENATAFGAAEASAQPKAGDFKSMLAVCDKQLESCEKDAVGVPFLAGAYIALWFIVLGFLFASRVSLRRTRQELQELRVRLLAVEEESSR